MWNDSCHLCKNLEVKAQRKSYAAIISNHFIYVTSLKQHGGWENYSFVRQDGLKESKWNLKIFNQRMIRVERLPFIIVITFVIVIIVIIFNIKTKTKIRGKPNRCFVNLVKNNPSRMKQVLFSHRCLRAMRKWDAEKIPGECTVQLPTINIIAW